MHLSTVEMRLVTKEKFLQYWVNYTHYSVIAGELVPSRNKWKEPFLLSVAII